MCKIIKLANLLASFIIHLIKGMKSCLILQIILIVMTFVDNELQLLKILIKNPKLMEKFIEDSEKEEL